MVLRTDGGHRRRRNSKSIPANFSDGSNGSSVFLPSFPFSSQDSNSINDFCNRKSKREKTQKKNNNKKKEFKNLFLFVRATELTSTLTEAQEYREVIERVDEINFALDGLRRAQPVHIRRESLLSLLSICATAHHCRLLHTQGLAKRILDAIVGLSIDDHPSNLAAATLLYILTGDGQDDHLLESTGCVQYLIKLLRPIVSLSPKLGPKLVASRKNVGLSTYTKEGLDSSSVAIFSRIKQILVNCKELKSTYQNDSGVERPELCPKWLALLTMEKACSPTFSLDEKSFAVQKTGGNFKEKLREFGGLDAVFDTTLHCQSDLEVSECWLEDRYLSNKNLRNKKRLKSLALLLKCLKIMQNAIVLSEENQTHLLGLKRKLSPQTTPFSFVELVINVIKMLSDLCKSQNDDNRNSVSDTPSTPIRHNYSQQMRVSSSTSRGSDCKTSMTQDDSLDPFAFDEDDIAPSKWDLLLRKQRKYLPKSYEATSIEFEDGCLSQTNVSQQELNNGGEEASSLLTNCLLSSLRVLMNLSHENPVGCQQIATYGGLKIMPLLIARHVPSLQIKPNRVKDHRNKRHFTDQEFDFLIAILGLLTNLLEKDGHSRSWLAAASVVLPTSEGPGKEVRRGVIPLLCSIFLANQGGAEGSEEDGYEKWIVEAYSALVLAFLSTESKGIREAIADNLPDHNLSILVPALVEYVEFHLALNLISPETHKGVCEAIESCGIP